MPEPSIDGTDHAVLALTRSEHRRRRYRRRAMVRPGLVFADALEARGLPPGRMVARGATVNRATSESWKRSTQAIRYLASVMYAISGQPARSANQS